VKVDAFGAENEKFSLCEIMEIFTIPRFLETVSTVHKNETYFVFAFFLALISHYQKNVSLNLSLSVLSPYLK